LNRDVAVHPFAFPEREEQVQTELLQRACAPLFLKERTMLPIRTIVYAVNFGAAVGPATEYACSLARDYKARLIVLHVVTPPLLACTDAAILPANHDARGEAEQKLQSFSIPYDEKLTERHVAEGDPATEIVRLGTAARADLIVLEEEIGDEVVRKASCPVLTLNRMSLDSTSEWSRGPEELAGV
jgi:hypothetical protein